MLFGIPSPAQPDSQMTIRLGSLPRKQVEPSKGKPVTTKGCWLSLHPCRMHLNDQSVDEYLHQLLYIFILYTCKLNDYCYMLILLITLLAMICYSCHIIAITLIIFISIIYCYYCYYIPIVIFTNADSKNNYNTSSD